MAMKTLVGAAMDIIVGLAACTAVFGLVVIGSLDNHQIAAGVAVIYFVAGLVRTDRSGLPQVLRVVLISIFGCLAAFMMTNGSFIMWAPYALGALMFTAVGILVRRNWEALSITSRWTALIAPIVVAVLAGGLALPAYFEFAGTHIRGPASDFELQRLDGGKIASEDLKGKVILLDFWDTHCGPCRKLMPEMEKLQARYEGDSRVAILVVNAGWETFEAAKKYVSENDYSLAFAYDPDAQASQSMRVWELPTTILIDTDFNYHSKHIAYEPGQEAAIVEHYGALIEEMLAEAG